MLLLSPALIRTLLSAENDRACTFHYVLLLMSRAAYPFLLLALSFFVEKIAFRGKCEFSCKIFVGGKCWACKDYLVCKYAFTQA